MIKCKWHQLFFVSLGSVFTPLANGRATDNNIHSPQPVWSTAKRSHFKYRLCKQIKSYIVQGKKQNKRWMRARKLERKREQEERQESVCEFIYVLPCHSQEYSHLHVESASGKLSYNCDILLIN